MLEVPTIFAISSGSGRAGIAVIRVSGPRASVAVERMAAPVPKPRRAVLRDIVDPDSGAIIDRGLVLWFLGPASATGEDLLELHVHGSPAVVRAVLGALASIPGLRMAERGEFARRAFENGKLDLTQVEGLADLIAAETEAQRRQALRQAGGALQVRFETWRADIVKAQALVEAAIDFSDEGDVADNAVSQAERVVSVIAAELAAHLDDNRRGEIVRDGFRVVLAGAPNAGKSSLLNSLAQRDAAIVSDEPGTTRDVISVRLDLGGLAVVISDTAGLREGGGKIEREGIRRTHAEAGQADLVIWLIDATQPVPDPPEGLVGGDTVLLRVVNKIDIADDCDPIEADGGVVFISAARGDGIGSLTEAIARSARDRIGVVDDVAPITQVRHRRVLETCREACCAFLDGRTEPIELRVEWLRQAGNDLGRLTGRIDVEEILGAIFGQFCIGK